jgi:hypothetical protein
MHDMLFDWCAWIQREFHPLPGRPQLTTIMIASRSHSLTNNERFSTIANPLRQYGIPRLTVSLLNQLYDSEWISCRDVALYCYTLAVAGEETWRLRAFSRLLDRQVVLGKSEEDADERRKRRRQLHQSYFTTCCINGRAWIRALTKQQATFGQQTGLR